jgi:hypothetical protein
VTGPVVTGRNGEVSTPTSFDPAKASEDSYQTAAFQIAGPIVQKSLEQFLSGARFGREVEIISVSWASIGVEAERWRLVALLFTRSLVLVAQFRERDTAASITSRILDKSVGLSIASVAPGARAYSRRFSPKDVIATTGKSANSSFDLTPTIKSKPLRTGIAMSVTITSGRFTCISANASRTFRTAFTL